MANIEVQEVRVDAVKDLLSGSDIEELYGRDQANLEKIKSAARTEIPREVDEAVSTFLAELDIDLCGADPLVKPVLLTLFKVARVEGWKLEHRVLETKVKSWVVEVRVSKIEANSSEPAVYISSCHECGQTFDEKRYFCPNCSALIIKNE